MRAQVLLYWMLFVSLALVPASARASARPFPQHTAYASGTILPNHVSRSQLDQDVLNYYLAWKQRYLKSVSGSSPAQKYVFYNLEGMASPSSAVSCSEGHGYGMLATVIMADADPNAHTDYNALYYFYKAHTSSNNPLLMSWQQISSNGSIVDNVADGDDSATDGDMDIALSLLMADRQWASNGSINYRAEAIKLIQAILASEVNRGESILKLGDWVSDSDSTYGKGTRSSDFMLGHLRTFAQYDTANTSLWNAVLSKTASIANAQFSSGGSASTGLLPDFFKKNSSGQYKPTSGTYLESKHDGDYSWNACRTPWRLSVDFLLSGSTTMSSLLKKLNSWIISQTAGNPSNVKAGYYVLNGTNGKPYVTYNELAFTAPFAVSAMVSSTNQSWLNSLWKYMVNANISNGEYFGNTLKLQSMIVASGNWWIP